MPTALSKTTHNTNGQTFTSKDLKPSFRSGIVGLETLNSGSEFDCWTRVGGTGIVEDLDVFQMVGPDTQCSLSSRFPKIAVTG